MTSGPDAPSKDGENPDADREHTFQDARESVTEGYQSIRAAVQHSVGAVMDRFQELNLGLRLVIVGVGGWLFSEGAKILLEVVILSLNAALSVIGRVSVAVPELSPTQTIVILLALILGGIWIQTQRLSRIERRIIGMEQTLHNLRADGGEEEGGTTGGGAISGAIIGAALGSSYGPQGAVVGGLIGLVLGDEVEKQSNGSKQRLGDEKGRFK